MRMIERFQLHSGLLLFRERFLLLLSKAALAELIEQSIDRIFLAGAQSPRLGTANQHGDAVDIELLEAPPEFLRGPTLNVLTAREQVEHVRALRDVSKVRGEDRIECLRDEPAHIPKALDNARRFLVVDVKHE